MSSNDFTFAFRRSFVHGLNDITMIIYPNVNYSDPKPAWKGHMSVSMIEFKLGDDAHRAKIEQEGAVIIGELAYLPRIENFWGSPRDLNISATKVLSDAYQLALATAERMIELLQGGIKLVDVYEAIGGHQYEHDKAMSQDLGIIRLSAEPLGNGFYLCFAEIWESLEELKAYYLSRFPTITFNIAESGSGRYSVEDLRAEGRHLVRKGQRASA